MSTLYLIRGVSGSGKTTFAKHLGVEIISEDDFFYSSEGEYLFDPGRLEDAYIDCFTRARRIMSGGRPLAVHSVFVFPEIFEDYFSLADDFGYTVFSLVVENRHNNISVHGVPGPVLDEQEESIRSNIKLRHDG